MRPRTLIRWGLLVSAVLAGVLAAVLFMVGGRRSSWRTRESRPAEAAYEVEMSPVGKVHFERVPDRALTLDANYNDMLVAIDQASKLVATGYRSNLYDGFYERLPGLPGRIQANSLQYVGGALDKERLYAIRAQVHHVDPVQLIASPGWSRADIDEIARNVGPFVANRYSRENSYPGKEPYTYYSLWELSARIAEVYRRPERIAALQAVYDEMVRSIEARLPPPESRPSVGLLMPAVGQASRFTPFCLSRNGFGTTQYRVLGVKDAFVPIRHLTYGDAGQGSTIDLEGLLAIDPDILVMPFGVYASNAERFATLTRLKDDPLGSRLRAVKSGRIYPGGTPLQGPVFLLFQLEMAAKQFYPELFGAFRPDHDYPAAERLFDRARVTSILRSEGASGR